MAAETLLQCILLQEDDTASVVSMSGLWGANPILARRVFGSAGWLDRVNHCEVPVSITDQDSTVSLSWLPGVTH
jgi:hypothetical protein